MSDLGPPAEAYAAAQRAYDEGGAWVDPVAAVRAVTDAVWRIATAAPQPGARCTCNPEGLPRDDRIPMAPIAQVIDHLCPWHGLVAQDRYRRRREALEREQAAYFDAHPEG